MTLKQLINEFCSCQDMAPLVPDDEGHYTIIADKFSVDCFYHAGKLYLHSVLVTLPDDEMRKSSLLHQLLSVCWAQQLNMDETLSIDELTGQLNLHCQISMNGLLLDKFENLIANFLDTLEYLESYYNDNAL